MIRRLQIKFIIIIMAIMSVVLLGIFAAVNITMSRSTDRQTLDMLKKIADSDGIMRGEKKQPGQHILEDIPLDNEPPPLVKPEFVPQTNFSVKVDNKFNIIEIISDANQSYTQNEVSAYLKQAQNSGVFYGITDGLAFLIKEKSYGKIVVFLDNTMQASSAIRLFWITLFVGIASLIVVFIVSIYLSKRAIEPVKKAYEAQKRFVADASHELKTPLTIICANADVLSQELSDNKWLGFIKAEAVRMNELVNNLLYLAKSDAAENHYSIREFDLSSAIAGTALSFESLCYENNKKLSLDIKEGVFFNGDEHSLCRVVIILLDNAVKNTNENGEISISLSLQNGKRYISVYNTGDGISDEDKAKIFDRFYRSDSSRARQTGGYGLGLSIASAIVKAHKGKITVESELGKHTRFTVII